MLGLRRPIEAIAAYRSCAEISPWQAECQLGLGIALREADQAEAALVRPRRGRQPRWARSAHSVRDRAYASGAAPPRRGGHAHGTCRRARPATRPTARTAVAIDTELETPCENTVKSRFCRAPRESGGRYCKASSRCAFRVSTFSTLKEAPGRSRRRQPEAHASRRPDQEGLRRHLQLDAARPHHAAQGRGDRPRGDEPRRRARGLPAAVVQPAELWQETGRWDKFGPQLLQLKDRHERDFLFGPTHEEVITDIVRKEIRSYRQLPVNLYQIQVKFRDEIRPRFGVMRGARVPDEGRVLVRRRPRRADAKLPGDVRRVRAHLHAAGARRSARSRPTPARSAASPRTSSRCSPTRARTRSRGRPRRDYAANVEQAEAVAPADRARRARRGDGEGADAGPVDLRGGDRSCSGCRSRAPSSA